MPDVVDETLDILDMTLPLRSREGFSRATGECERAAWSLELGWCEGARVGDCSRGGSAVVPATSSLEPKS